MTVCGLTYLGNSSFDKCNHFCYCGSNIIDSTSTYCSICYSMSKNVSLTLATQEAIERKLEMRVDALEEAGSSCRRQPGGAVSPASGGRTRAASCGPRRLRRAEGRGSRPWASRRGLGSQRSPLAGGSALVWTAFRGRAFLSGPHSPHRLLCSRSQGAARRVLGAAGGAEAINTPVFFIAKKTVLRSL